MSTVFEKVFFAPITKMFFGPKVVFFISEPETIKCILTGAKFNERLDIIYSLIRRPFTLLSEKRKIEITSLWLN